MTNIELPSFRRRKLQPVNPEEDRYKQLESVLRTPVPESEPPKVENFAPLAMRPRALEEPMEQVKTFGALPTKEIDEVLAAAKEQIAELEREAQSVRDMYVERTTRIVSDIKRLQEGVKLSMDTMRSLRQQCERLNSGLEKEEHQ